ncbi:Com family DNA-binding transcriptional regulator [Achromobacter seleniivolatilans]|uniref:Com family DNA-binding transcriptional regulator n=1 Tax=Achromobacter seleniivolatilans TaxID=3047478 RepID=A0ABY9M8H1_9BURK|nr:Com family DNA-binding transcriptional regulator [Achromobacter sp. R39]WMD23319.1 Com family DNA-binding transcriptional regulator [Achromobacter sp. R39]
MEELRCTNCGRKLAETTGYVRLNIKCSRCKTVNAFSMAESAPSAQSHNQACRRASSPEVSRHGGQRP